MRTLTLSAFLLLACHAGGAFAQAPAAPAEAAPISRTEPEAPGTLTAVERQALIDRHKAKSPIAEVPREEIRAAVEKYFGTPADLKRPDPTPEILEKVDDPQFERWHLRYKVEEDEFSYAYLFLPKPLPTAAKKRPLVMCPHPTADLGKNRISGVYTEPPPDEKEAAERVRRQYAADIARRGFITFAPDRAGYGERRLLKEGNYQVQMAEFRKRLGQRHPGWKLTSGKNVWDLQRGLDMLQTFDFIDHENVATIGHSLGAWDSIMLLAMDDRVKAGVVNSGGMPAFRPELWQDPTALRAYLANEKAQGLSGITNLFIILSAPRPLMYLHSMQDAYERGLPNLVEGVRSFTKYYRTVSRQQAVPAKADFNLFLHGYGHMFPLEAREAAYKFLELRLHLEK
jgi:pimeloyl-ACP methyl ester carboxylesterase